ncbi:MAG: 3-phosphoshikimate 1-carboxyvinyltransferase, partial [Candidatus Aureabacteria bacterium]|nr:3-phosphoshikimate 1-carboxyvinyltransferase [Candidatus Auribacterota bacterium]
NWLESEDTSVMIRCLFSLGFRVSRGEEAGGNLVIAGGGGAIPSPGASLNALNSGTTIRFLAGLVSLGRGRFILDGNERMRQRPIEPLLEALRAWGIAAHSLRGNGCPPIEIAASGIPGGECELGGDISSQFLSSLLLSGPYARKDLAIRIRGELVSRPYVEMTIRMMADFGVSVEREGWRTFLIPTGRRYRGRDYLVEGDASSASYFWAAAAITGGRARVTNIGEDSLQGDARFVEILEKMGATVRRGKDGTEVRGPIRRGIDVDLNDMPDLVPTLAVAALFAPGKTAIRNVANLRFKESDRLKAVAAEMRRIGVKAVELPDGLVFEGGDLRGAEIETYRDHRIAMSFSLAGLKVPGIKIQDPGCVAKTFPAFFDLFLNLPPAGPAGGGAAPSTDD